MSVRTAIRESSLSWFFGVILLLTLVGQAYTGLAEYNSSVTIDDLPVLSIGEYVTSSQFAVDVAENWQSEYLQFLLYIVLTVWLVQRGSPESKPVDETGGGDDKKSGGSVDIIARLVQPVIHSQKTVVHQRHLLGWDHVVLHIAKPSDRASGPGHVISQGIRAGRGVGEYLRVPMGRQGAHRSRVQPPEVTADQRSPLSAGGNRGRQRLSQSSRPFGHRQHRFRRRPPTD